MDYSVLFQKTLTDVGFDLIGQWNTFDPWYDPVQGWPLKLPTVEFKKNTLLLLHFQDFITVQNGQILELQQVEQFYGPNADQVLVTHWPHRLNRYYSGPVNLIEFNSHEYKIILNLRQRQSEWNRLFDSVKTVPWQSLNGRMCPHRRRAAAILESWGGGRLSYGNRTVLSDSSYATYRGKENEDNFIDLLDVYSQCAVNIVTETQYDQVPGIITEKTIMALLSKQIPVVIGYPGIVTDCMDLGFDMFTDLVDVSYDSLPDNQRVEQALLLNRSLIQGSIDLAPYQQRLADQQQWVLDCWPEQMEQQFRQACEQLARRQGL